MNDQTQDLGTYRDVATTAAASAIACIAGATWLSQRGFEVDYVTFEQAIKRRCIEATTGGVDNYDFDWPLPMDRWPGWVQRFREKYIEAGIAAAQDAARASGYDV